MIRTACIAIDDKNYSVQFDESNNALAVSRHLTRPHIGRQMLWTIDKGMPVNTDGVIWRAINAAKLQLGIAKRTGG